MELNLPLPHYDLIDESPQEPPSALRSQPSEAPKGLAAVPADRLLTALLGGTGRGLPFGLGQALLDPGPLPGQALKPGPDPVHPDSLGKVEVEKPLLLALQVGELPAEVLDL